MGLFDRVSDVRDHADKRRQAREYTQRARELVEEGRSLYENAYDKVRVYASETEYRLKKHEEYKKSIAEELGSSIGTVINQFKTFHIDERVISKPIINDFTSSTSINSLNGSFHAFSTNTEKILGARMDIPGTLSRFISDDDYYEARRQRDEAKRYKEQMKLEREKLYRYKEQMEEIRSFISAEKNELDSLMNKVRKMTAELKTEMQKNTFTKEEADYLKGIHRISETIIELLSTGFLGDSFAISQKYKDAFAQIKRINAGVPSSPTITDVGTRNALNEILEGTIRY